LKRTVSLRLDDGLVDWLDGYAAVRGVSRSVLVQAALVAFVEVCGRGVPELVVWRGDGGPVSRAGVVREARVRARVLGVAVGVLGDGAVLDEAVDADEGGV